MFYAPLQKQKNLVRSKVLKEKKNSLDVESSTEVKLSQKNLLKLDSIREEGSKGSKGLGSIRGSTSSLRRLMTKKTSVKKVSSFGTETSPTRQKSKL